MALFNANMIEVHVLLVGSDVVSLLETSKLLEFNSYKARLFEYPELKHMGNLQSKNLFGIKVRQRDRSYVVHQDVTAVRMATIASSMLAKEKVKYDVVMVDVSSSDIQGFQLVHDAINLDYTVILMSDNPNATLVKCAIEDGAFLFIQKPATMEVLKYLWQHVLRENSRKSKENARFRAIMSTIENSNLILNSGQNMIHPNNIEGNINVHEHGSRNMVYQIGLEGFKFGYEDDTIDRRKKPKICTEWTRELHEKFVEAVKELGEGRCFPRDILELMNVPGLKRMQVASHLQKCRQGWKPNQESKQNGSASSKSNDSIFNGHSRPKKCGSYPRIAKGTQPKFLVRNKGKNEQSPPPKVVEDSNGFLEPPETMRQNIEISDNVSNNIGNMNEISSKNVNGDMVVESNHEGWIPFEDSFDFALDNFAGMNQADFNFEGLGFDQIFSQIPAAPDEEPERFWRSFLSNISSDQRLEQ